MNSSRFLTIAVAVAGAVLTACRPPRAPAPPRDVVVAVPIEDIAPAPVPPPAPAEPTWRPAPGRMMTRWAADVSPTTVHSEYPRPQMVRPVWANLNGLWQVSIGHDTNTTPTHAFGRDLPGRILVPFAMESALSGIGSHANGLVYRRKFRAPPVGPDTRLLLHFGAVDWHTTVYVNGRRVGTHTGGYDTFSFDITDALTARSPDVRPEAEQELVVAVFDPTDEFGQPRGKQVSKPEGIWYTPVTGIWQTVWLEPVAARGIDHLTMTPDVAGGALRLTVHGRGPSDDLQVEAVATGNGGEYRITGPIGRELRVPIPRPRLWGPSDPFLYKLRVTLRDTVPAQELVDRVDSYFGMRTVSVGTDRNGFRRIMLNGEPVFQVGPLDQGWWPDGLYTAPTDAALRFDLEMTKALGFNMTRKHIKVEPARWYYYADSMGIPVWQDMPSGWNDSPKAQEHFVAELRAMIEDLRNHPSIVVWVPFNEKWGQFDVQRMVSIIQGMDSSRLVNDVSGWQHENVGDIIDVHRYQGPQAMRGANGRIAVVGEFGGLGYKENGHTWAGDAWGYGGLFQNREALADRYDLLMKRLYRDRDTHGIGAGVYTQMTDVEVELNGFFTYDRAILKFDTARMAATNRGHAPYILPELTDFTDTVRVMIHQGTPTELRYTTDGSEPTAASPLYRAPFLVRRNTTVRARSFLNGRPTAAAETRTEFTKGPGRPAVTAAVAPGLRYEFFRDTTPEPHIRMNWPVRWQLERPEKKPEDITPHRTGTVATVTLAPADTAVMFGMRYTGYIRVPRAGVYTFTALSDDGAGMWFGDRNVFWSLGQSPKTTETSGQIALAAGLHPITVTFFQAYGPRALELYIEGPGVRRRQVPASMLFQDRAPAPTR